MAAQLWLKLNEKIPYVICDCVRLLTKEKYFAAIRNKNTPCKFKIITLK